MNEPASVDMQQQEALSKLRGGLLSSVQFVLSYLILGFSEKGALTSLVWPEIHEGKNKSRFGDVGYRDKLCSLIGETAKNLLIKPGDIIVIEFANGIELRVPLGAYQGKGERAILTSPDHFLYVF
jgi:hypothetical protein